MCKKNYTLDVAKSLMQLKGMGEEKALLLAFTLEELIKDIKDGAKFKIDGFGYFTVDKSAGTKCNNCATSQLQAQPSFLKQSKQAIRQARLFVFK